MKFTVSYNKAIIMKSAHDFYKSGRFGKDWSVCLRKAWANARAIKFTLEGIGEEARTYGGWLALGYEVIHGEHNVGQCIINSIRYMSKTTETLSYFTRSQVCVIGTQPPKA